MDDNPEIVDRNTYGEAGVAIDLKSSGIDVNNLASGKEENFEIDPERLASQNNEDETNFYFDKEVLFKQLNYECLDDGTDESCTPFSRMMLDMEPLSGEDGGVTKKILKHGAGQVVPAGSLCRVHYNAYLEYNDEPFDSSRLRNRQKQFKLGQGEVLAGWEIGVATMKRGETSRFMVASEYAYGKLGCPPRIPTNATILFEIELVSFVDQGAADNFENFSEEERKQASFEQLLAVVDTLRVTGNDMFSINQVARAAGKYSQAVRLLENAHLKDEKEENLMKQACLKLYLNLSLCDIKQARSGRACKFARKALDIDPRNVKALYRLACGLRQLGEYEEAKRKISKAHRLDPRNADITKELNKLDEEMLRYKQNNMSMSQKMLNLNVAAKTKVPDEKPKKSASANNMMDATKKMLGAFKYDDEQTSMAIPANLTKTELEAVEKCANDLGLHFHISATGNKSYRVSKVDR